MAHFSAKLGTLEAEHAKACSDLHRENVELRASLCKAEDLGDSVCSAPVAAQEPALSADDELSDKSAARLSKALLQLFVCPVTMRVFKDPQMGPDGHTYEAEAIKQWLLEHPTSPLTRHPMSSELLRPNRLVQEAVAIIAKHTGEAGPVVAQPLPHLRSPGMSAQEVQVSVESLAKAIDTGNREVALELLGRPLPDKVLNAAFKLDWIKCTALHLAIIAELPDVAAAILHRLDFRGLIKLSNNGLTALHLAALHGFAPLCDQIVDVLGLWHVCSSTRGSCQVLVKSTGRVVSIDSGLQAAELARRGGHELLAEHLDRLAQQWRSSIEPSGAAATNGP